MQKRLEASYSSVATPMNDQDSCGVLFCKKIRQKLLVRLIVRPDNKKMSCNKYVIIGLFVSIIVLPISSSFSHLSYDQLHKQTNGNITTLYTSNFGNPVNVYSDSLIAQHEPTSTLVVSTGQSIGNYSQVFVGLMDRNSGTFYSNITIVGDEDCFPLDLIVQDDDVFVAGATKASVFDGISLSSIQAAFVIRFKIVSSSSTPSLQKQWTKVFGGAGSTIASSVAVNGSIVISYGATNGQYLDGVPSSGNQLFVRKTDYQGNWISTVFVNVSLATPRKMAVDSTGNIFVTAISILDNPLCLGGYQSSFDILLIKLNTTGGFQWCQQIGSSSDDDVADIMLQEDLGSIVLMGYADFSGIKDSSGTVLENGIGLNDAILIKYSMDGVYQNGTFLGTAGADYGMALDLNSGKNLIALIATVDASNLTIYKFAPDSLEQPIFNYTMSGFQLLSADVSAETSRKGYLYTVGLTISSVQPCTLITTALLDSYPDVGVSPSPSPSPQYHTSDKSSTNKAGIIAGSTIGAVVVLAGAIGGFLFFRRSRQRRKMLNEDVPLSSNSRQVNTMTSNYTGIDDTAKDSKTASKPTTETRPATQTIQARDVDKFSGWEIDFNEIQFVRELGKGAFGVVYLCRWRNTDCATKQLDFGQDEQSVQRFLKEAENVRSLKPHPNVCAVLGVCTNPSFPICIVMEYLPDGNLEDLIYEKKIDMNASRLLEFAKDVASGMTHLHAENILHCDLACRNLLVAAKGANKYQIKIADFGLSRVLSAETYTVSKQAAFPTRWTAPETFKTGKISRANDVWSFGVVLWEMMEGTRPFREYNNQEVVEKVIEGYRLPRPKMVIPDSLWNLIQKCWDADPNNRPSFNEVYQYLSYIEV